MLCSKVMTHLVGHVGGASCMRNARSHGLSSIHLHGCIRHGNLLLPRWLKNACVVGRCTWQCRTHQVVDNALPGLVVAFANGAHMRKRIASPFASLRVLPPPAHVACILGLTHCTACLSYTVGRSALPPRPLLRMVPRALQFGMPYLVAQLFARLNHLYCLVYCFG